MAGAKTKYHAQPLNFHLCIIFVCGQRAARGGGGGGGRVSKRAHASAGAPFQQARAVHGRRTAGDIITGDNVLRAVLRLQMSVREVEASAQRCGLSPDRGQHPPSNLHSVGVRGRQRHAVPGPDRSQHPPSNPDTVELWPSKHPKHSAYYRYEAGRAGHAVEGSGGW